MRWLAAGIVPALKIKRQVDRELMVGEIDLYGSIAIGKTQSTKLAEACHGNAAILVNFADHQLVSVH